MVQKQHGSLRLGRNVLHPGNQSGHVAITVLICGMEPRYGVEDDEPVSLAPLDEVLGGFLVHQIKLLTERRVDRQTLSDGLAGIGWQVPPDRVKSMSDCGGGVFGGQVEDWAMATRLDLH